MTTELITEKTLTKTETNEVKVTKARKKNTGKGIVAN